MDLIHHHRTPTITTTTFEFAYIPVLLISIFLPMTTPKRILSGLFRSSRSSNDDALPSSLQPETVTESFTRDGSQTSPQPKELTVSLFGESENEDVSLVSTCPSWEADSTRTATPPHSPDRSLGLGYTLGDHADYLSIRREKKAGQHFFCDLSHFFTESKQINLVTEYCSALSLDQLRELLIGIEIDDDNDDKPSKAHRTVTIRLRPDTPNTDIMTPVHQVCRDNGISTVKVLENGIMSYRCEISSVEEIVSCCPSSSYTYIVDARVCTSRLSPFERQLLVRFFFNDNQGEIATASAVDDCHSLFPLNEHLKECRAFYRFIDEIGISSKDDFLADIPSPKRSPRATSAFLLGRYSSSMTDSAIYQRLSQEREGNRVFLELSNRTLYQLWKLLNANVCTFDTIEELPLIEPVDRSKNNSFPFFDPSYTSQIGVVASNDIAPEVNGMIEELNLKALRKYTCEEVFLKVIRNARATYDLESIELGIQNVDYLPSFKQPVSYSVFAMNALQEWDFSPEHSPFEVADMAAIKVYHACCSQDDKAARDYVRKAYNVLVQDMIVAQTYYVALLTNIECDVKTEAAAKIFDRMARKALNSKGRAELCSYGRVPLVFFRYLKGECLMTSSAILCITHQGVGDKFNLYDLKAVSFQKRATCLLIIDINSQEKLHELSNPDVDIDELLVRVEVLTEIQEYRSLQRGDQE